MHIEKSISIQKPKREVFEFLKLIRNQDHFSVWNMKDPGKKVNTTGTDGSVGFTYSWDSADKSVGSGTQEIKRVVDGQQIDCELRFERPMKNTAMSTFKISEDGPTATRVTWTFDGPTKFPMSLFTFIFKRMLGKDLQQGLDNLKARLERKAH